MSSHSTKKTPSHHGGTTDESMMRAITQRQYGGPEVLSYETVPRPTLKPDEALVHVHAAGLDRGTWHVMTGKPYIARLALGLRRPKATVPGLDLAGVVVAVGSDVKRVNVGDEVFGIGRGSFAEFTAAKESKLAIKPSSIPFEHAAAIPVSGLTAFGGFCDVGKLQAGQKVLIIGASGGVGSYAVQIAKAFGADVTGVCSASKRDFVRELGADRVIDYATEDFARNKQAYDLIFDLGGNPTLPRLRSALTPNGTLVIGGGEGGGRWFGGLDRQLRAVLLSPFLKQRLVMLVAKEHYSGLEPILELIAKGQVRPAIERTYELEDAAAALRHLESGRTFGKLVITTLSDS
jgi:NADPH:quinone reductase-like Zn-dependent oxidoreductase